MNRPPPGKYPILGVSLAAIFGIILAENWPGILTTSLILVLTFSLVWAVLRRTTALLSLVVAGFYLMHGLQYERDLGRQLAAELGDASITVQGTGIVDSAPREILSSTGRIRSSFQVTDVSLEIGKRRIAGPLNLLLTWPNAAVELGDCIQFEGSLFAVAPPRNPGEFDYAAWLGRRQIFNAVSVQAPRTATVLERGAGKFLRRYAERSKHKLVEIITRDLRDAPVEAGVIAAMLLGAKDDTGDTIQELFQKTGTTHLFSVSGLHVSMLGAIALFAFTAFRMPRRLALALIIPTVFAYTLITGWNPASVRAAIMTSMFVLATLLDRPALSINTLAAACFLILVSNTNDLFAAGFQLSFLVVGAIILLSAPLGRRLKEWTRPDPFIPRKLLRPWQKFRWLVAGRVSEGLALTLSAWVGSLPLTAWYFNLLTPVALLANLVIVPMSLVVLILGVLSMLAAPLSSWLVVAFNNANWAWTKALVFGLHLLSLIPFGSAFVGPHWWQQRAEEKITVFDLGSGGATVIETSETCWLVDCGSENDYRRVVRSYLQQRGINQLSGVLLTHGDSSHVGGLPQLKADYPNAVIYLPEAGKKSLVFRKLTSIYQTRGVSAGMQLSIGPEASLHVLWPPPEVDSARADDHGLVLRLDVRKQHLLFTADAGFPTEASLLSEERVDELQADYVFSGRDRLDPGGTEAFLQATGAGTLLATAKRFPAAEQISRGLVETCQKLKIQLFRFDQSGAVQLSFREDQVTVRPFLSTTAPVAN